MKLVIDVGGTFIKYALMENNCEIKFQDKIKTPAYEVSLLKEAFKSIIKKYEEQVEGIAFSFPGMIDSDSGFLHSAGALQCLNNTNFFELIGEITPLPLSIENDGKCAALAESWVGNLADCRDGIVVILGTGVGGGIIKDKKVHRGKHFSAGEFSFLICNHTNPSFSSAWAILSSVPGLVARVSKAKGLNDNEIDGIKLFELIHANDEIATQLFDEYTKNLMLQLYNLQCVYDPEKILIGGGISKQPLLLENIKAHYAAFKASIPMPIPELNIDTCKYYNDSNLIGALKNFLDKHSITQ